MTLQITHIGPPCLEFFERMSLSKVERLFEEIYLVTCALWSRRRARERRVFSRVTSVVLNFEPERWLRPVQPSFGLWSRAGRGSVRCHQSSCELRLRLFRMLFVCTSSSRSRMPATGIARRSNDWRNAWRKNSPSAVWISACEARISSRSGKGLAELSRMAAPTNAKPRSRS